MILAIFKNMATPLCEKYWLISPFTKVAPRRHLSVRKKKEDFDSHDIYFLVNNNPCLPKVSMLQLENYCFLALFVFLQILEKS